MKNINTGHEINTKRMWRICAFIFGILFLAYVLGYAAHLIYDFF